MSNKQGNNGPRVGASHGRNRQTLVNRASHIDPSTALSLGSAEASAKYNLLQQLALLRQQRAQVKSQYGVGLAQARQQRLGDVTSAANSAAERGLVGSSVDASGRAGAFTQFATTQAGLRADKASGLLGLKQQAVGARGDYSMQMAQIAAQRAMAQAQARAQQQLQAAQEAQAAQAASGYGDLASMLLQQLQGQRQGNNPQKRQGVSTTAQQWSIPQIIAYIEKNQSFRNSVKPLY